MTLLRSLAAGLCLLAVPDILPEGMKGIAVESRIDPGVLADTACMQHIVGKDETLSTIAEAKLGKAERWQEIATLNAIQQPDRLLPGQALWLPPKAPPAAGQELVFLYTDGRRAIGNDPKPLVPGVLSQPLRAGLTIYVVPASVREAFLAAAAAKRPAFVEFLAAQKASVQVVKSPSVGRTVPRGDPTHRRSDAYRLERGADGALALTVKSTAYDKDGKVLELVPVAPGKKIDPAKQELLLLLLALCGGAFLLWRSRRQAPHAALA